MLKHFRSFFLALIAMGIAMSGISNAQADLQKIKETLPKLLGATNQGTEFVFAFHPAWEEIGPNNRIKIYISSAVETDVRLIIPKYGDEPCKLIRTKPNDIVVIDLLPSEAQPYTRGGGGDINTLMHTQIWRGAGLILEADEPIIVYGMTRYQYTSDGFLAIPTHALGKQYIVSAYRETANFTFQSLTPYVSVVGVYDNTDVTFSFGGNPDSRIIDADHGNMVILPGKTMTATLNRGDDWLIATEAAYSDLGGSMVQASKPVAVISGNHCAYIPTDVAACDYIIEQEYPMNAWGRKYHVTKIAGRKRSSIVRLFAKEANTRFYKDYNNQDTTQAFFVNAAAWGVKDVAWLETRASMDSNTGMVVTADKPIEAVQYNPGINDDQVASDPFQMMLIPEEQFMNDIIFNTPGIRGGFSFDVNYINIVYKSDSTGQIPDDLYLGDVSPTTGETNFMKLKDWSSAPGDRLYDPDYRNSSIKIFSKIVQLPYDAVWRIKSETQKIMAYSYGFSWCDSYGYPTSGLFLKTGSSDGVPPIPQFTLLKDGTTDTTNGNYPFVMDLGDNESSPSNLALVLFHKNNSINYNFEIKSEDKNWIQGEANKVHWKAWVIDPSKDAVAFLTFADRAGNDTTIMLQYSAEVSIEEQGDNDGFYMNKIKPNPIGNREANLEFSIGISSATKIQIISSDGTILKVLVDEFLNAGMHRVRLPLEIMPSGVYFIEMQSGEFKEVQKIVVQK